MRYLVERFAKIEQNIDLPTQVKYRLKFMYMSQDALLLTSPFEISVGR